ncbi:MAG: amino acid permease [Actinomycetaceae bacterium]|nr:amino acid permease [Actinomycetaceae bacterium]
MSSTSASALRDASTGSAGDASSPGHAGDASAQPATSSGLRRTMESRHLVMIALGGVIGSGLFLSSGYTIGQAGPLGAVIAYGIGALVAYMVMTCLGELALVYPVSGGFHVYASRELGPAWGFATAWLYWMCWAVALGSEFTACAMLMGRWFPGVDDWVWCLLFAILLFSLNAFSSRVFGEAEFWLSLIKVVAVISVIIIGLVAIGGFYLGSNPFGGAGSAGSDTAIGLANFATDKGFFPAGIGGVLMTILAVFYAFSGTELIGVAAGETRDPGRAIPRAIRTAVLRLTIFFIGAIFVIAAILPYDRAGVSKSTFVDTLDHLGISGAADIMNIVVITALLSAGNSGLFSCTRMLHSLASEGEAPAALARTTRRGIPMVALAVSMLGGLASLLTSVVAAETVFLALVSIAGFAVVAVWIAIVASQLAMRRRLIRASQAGEPGVETLTYRSPLFPVLPIVALVALFTSFIGAAFDSEQMHGLLFGVPFTLVCLAYYRLRYGAGVFRPTPRAESLPGRQ